MKTLKFHYLCNMSIPTLYCLKMVSQSPTNSSNGKALAKWIDETYNYFISAKKLPTKPIKLVTTTFNKKYFYLFYSI